MSLCGFWCMAPLLCAVILFPQLSRLFVLHLPLLVLRLSWGVFLFLFLFFFFVHERYSWFMLIRFTPLPFFLCLLFSFNLIAFSYVIIFAIIVDRSSLVSYVSPVASYRCPTVVNSHSPSFRVTVKKSLCGYRGLRGSGAMRWCGGTFDELIVSAVILASQHSSSFNYRWWEV